VYVMNTVSFTKAGFRFGGELEIYEIPGHRNMEVDEETDLFMADAMLSCMNRVKPLENMPSALIMDFDGVFTDNRVLVLQDGTEAVWCSRGDGWGLTMLRKTGLKMLILSTETNPVVGARAKKLGIECIQVAGDKLPVLKEWLRQNGLDIDDVMYVGNDTNDMECILAVGVGVAVSDSVAKIIEAADVVLAHPGGNGAIREVCDLLLSSE
jgi:YrbI family 3-deoxy-D-manno-octulosonate 8-phosphate phosphatase